ncbi:hypothetical protein BG006_005027 [Podila minutissima]|uniref:Uncharacterized protein n=1 Tax=Podila minutissima TaxID=64525 RepID=A0A9P5SKH0_9FUNG|nr:hypothetical protein BG006_005027 [Podila minutissima]
MSSASTVGIYSGLPADPNAEACKMFTEWENQQDGLAMIFKYCQTKSGFSIDSNNPVPFARSSRTSFSALLSIKRVCLRAA